MCGSRHSRICPVARFTGVENDRVTGGDDRVSGVVLSGDGECARGLHDRAARLRDIGLNMTDCPLGIEGREDYGDLALPDGCAIGGAGIRMKRIVAEHARECATLFRERSGAETALQGRIGADAHGFGLFLRNQALRQVLPQTVFRRHKFVRGAETPRPAAGGFELPRRPRVVPRCDGLTPSVLTSTMGG